MTTLRQADEQALEALKMAQKAMGLIGADLVCEAAHHEKKDRHQIGEPCPIQARWHQAFAAIREALAQSRSDEEQPASKPWVGLTDEEVLSEAKRFALGLAFPFKGITTPEMFARAIEAKLKEKNT